MMDPGETLEHIVRRATPLILKIQNIFKGAPIRDVVCIVRMKDTPACLVLSGSWSTKIDIDDLIRSLQELKADNDKYSAVQRTNP